MQLRRFQAFSFLCTFVPESEKTIERTFAPVELWFKSEVMVDWYLPVLNAFAQHCKVTALSTATGQLLKIIYDW